MLVRTRAANRASTTRPLASWPRMCKSHQGRGRSSNTANDGQHQGGRLRSLVEAGRPCAFCCRADSRRRRPALQHALAPACVLPVVAARVAILSLPAARGGAHSAWRHGACEQRLRRWSHSVGPTAGPDAGRCGGYEYLSHPQFWRGQWQHLVRLGGCARSAPRWRDRSAARGGQACLPSHVAVEARPARSAAAAVDPGGFAAAFATRSSSVCCARG